MEGELLKLLRQNKEAGGSASLTFFTTRDGKLKAKLEVELDPSAPTSPGSTSPLPATAPAPGGGRRRRKGASAKAKAKARAALHRQPKLLPLYPLLHQEMPVLHWKPQHHISNTIPPCDILPTSSSPLRPLQGVAVSCLWEGCQCHLLVASTWTAHLLLHLPPHSLHLHPLLHLLQGL